MATANDGISRFSASTAYGVPTFTQGVTTPSITSPAGVPITLSSDTAVVLGGTQTGMDVTFIASTALSNTPMPFFAVYYLINAINVTLPLSFFPAQRVIFEVTGVAQTLSRPAGATYTIAGIAGPYTFPAIGTFLLYSVDPNSYNVIEMT